MIDLDKVRLGAACCIKSGRTCICPEECPYEDMEINGDLIYCETALLMDLQTLIPDKEGAQ